MSEITHQTNDSTDVNQAIYLYSLARPECLAAAIFSQSEDRLPGVDQDFPVSAIHLDRIGIVAVFSLVNPADFSESNLQDLAWIGPRARIHESVVQQVMLTSPVLPVKFATIYRSQSGLTNFVNHNGASILKALHQVHNKAEWTVKAYVDEAQARLNLTCTNPEIQELTARISQSPGLRYMQQKQIDIRIETALNQWALGVSQTVEEALTPHAVGMSTLRLHAPAMTGRPERMIFNGSFLLENSMVDQFQSVVDKIRSNAKMSGLIFECRGPWPPYHFCPTLSASTP